MPRVYISAGEASGDIHASLLARELLARDRSLEVFGMGGRAMREAGCDIVQPIDRLDVMGFAEVLWNLRYIRGVFRRLVALLRERWPDVAVLVDYPGYHMRFAAALRELGIPVVIYIAPQVWAWKPGRSRRVAELARKVLVIFDFEEPIFREAGADVEFVGHPLLDEMALDAPGGDARKAFGLGADEPLVAMLPGTRRQVVKRLLPVFTDAARAIRAERPETRFAIGTRDGSPLASAGRNAAAVHDLAPPVERRALLRDASAAMLASGTATLEAALLGCPGVVGYRMGALNYAIGKRVVRIPHIALANIVLGERVYPELIQGALEPRAVEREIGRLLGDAEAREDVSRRLRTVRGKLGEPGASARAAEAVLGIVG